MKKILAKLASLLLILSLVFTNLPVAALAEGGDMEPVLEQPPEQYSDGGIVSMPISFSYSDIAGPQKSPGDIPAYYRLGSTGQTSVKNQNPYGTCWAHAALASAESILELDGLADEPDLSEWQLAYFTYTSVDGAPAFYLAPDDTPYDAGGNDQRAAAMFTRGVSPVLESEVPYKSATVNTSAKPIYSLNNWSMAYRGSATDNADWKALLMDKGALSISYYSSSYYNFGTTTSYYNPIESSTNHAVTLVGWDDTYSASNFSTTPAGDGAWIVKNSWGTDWGDDGYFYLSYYDATLASDASAFELEQKTNGETIYTYDDLGFDGTLNFGSTIAYAKSIFTATGSQSLTEVGIYTKCENTDYTIQVKTKDSSGALVNAWSTPQSGTVALPGFTRIALSSAVPLSAGQQYEVIVSYANPDLFADSDTTNDKTYMPVELSTTGSYAAEHSFYSSNGISWSDMYYFSGRPLDSCIFAYTVPRAVTSHTVSFDSQGGSAVASSTVETGALVPEPAAPARAGYSFTGWFRDAACTAKWNFAADTMPDGNLSLYAGWAQNQYSVTFDSRGGSAVASASVASGALVPEPAAPAMAGYSFTGWYRDAACTAKWNFSANTMPEGNLTLYAGWALNQYTVSFNSQGGSAVAPAGAGYGSTVAEPAAPARNGYYFAGWYREPSCANKWNFAADTVSSDFTLYARWATQAQAATLSGITLSAGKLSPAFSLSRKSYTVSLDENTGSVTITPVKTYAGATLTINGRKAASKTVSVACGKSASLTVKVALGKKSMTVRLTVKRAKSANNLLSSLKASAGSLSPAFNPNVTSYTLTLPEGTAKVKLTAAKASKLAGLSNGSKTYTLKNGQTVKATIKVKSQAGKTRTYTVFITRAKSTNALLTSLKSSVKGLTPAFRYYATNYTLTLPASKSYVTFSWKAANPLARTAVYGKKMTSRKISIARGQTVTMAIVVTAQAGNTQTYTVTVTRQ